MAKAHTAQVPQKIRKGPAMALQFLFLSSLRRENPLGVQSMAMEKEKYHRNILDLYSHIKLLKSDFQSLSNFC
jgi:hypothetical protein